MKKFLIIILSNLFIISNLSAETFTAALKKAYKNNSELNAERENISISEQELKISMSSYFPTITLEGSKSQDETDKLTNRDCLLYTSPSPRDKRQSRMPSSA